MPVDWIAHRRAAIEPIEAAVDANSDEFPSSTTGPVTFDRLDYPHAEVLPQRTDHQGGPRYDHSVFLNFYFEWDKHSDYVDDVLAPAMTVVGSAMDELAGEGCVVAYKPTTIQDFAGELNNGLVLLLSVEMQVTTLAEFAD